MIYVNARFLSQPMTGVQRFAYQISSGLRELRDDIRFVCPMTAGHTPQAQALGAIAAGTGNGHAWEQFALPRYLHGAGDCELLLNLGNTAPLMLGGLRQISTLHDISFRRFPEGYSWKFRLAYAFITRMMLRSSVALVTVSEFSRQEISSSYRYPSERIHVIGNAVDPRFRPAITSARTLPEKPYLLAVSSSVHHKNFHRLIDAYAAWPLSREIDLKIVGGQAASFARQDYADTPGVSLTGRISDEELIGIYQRARAFVFPSLYEGFGIPPLEAQACGCPVISSNAAAMPEVLGTSALYFDPLSTSDIQRAMTLICTDDALHRDLATRGLANTRRFSWNESAQRLSSILDTLRAA